MKNNKPFFTASNDQIESLKREIVDELLARLAGLIPAQKATSEEQMLNGGAASTLLGISKTTLWRWVNEGKITPIRISGKIVRYRRSDLIKLLGE